MRSRILFAVFGVAGLSLVTACGSGSAKPSGMAGMDQTAMPASTAGSSSSPGMPSMSATPSTPSTPSMSGMAPGDAPMAMGDGLATSDQGFTFAPAAATLGADGLKFQILGADGMPVTMFEPEQTKLMHFYLVRSDLTGFQHVHPTMAADGTWTAPLKAAAPGTYRAYASFVTKGADGKPKALVLSKQLASPGSGKDEALPAPSATTTVDGYTVTVDTTQLMAGMAMPLKVSIAKAGKPVTDLQPYLATYAHLTAFHAGDQAMAHLHPEGAVAKTDTGGPDLTFEATLPKAGDWRLFLQFQTGGTLHTAAMTLKAG
jgi:hypothetical protein